MKWLPYENCLISEDRRVLKASSFDKIPTKVLMSFQSEIFIDAKYQAHITQKALYGDPYAFDGHYTLKNEVTGVTFETEKFKTIVDEYYLKQFKQKSSKFFLSNTDFPLIIRNKNYIVIISPCNVGKLIQSLEVA